MNQNRSLWIFTFTALIVFGAMIGGAAWRQGWFLPQEKFAIHFQSADGLFKGTSVVLSGLKVGEVSDVELDPSGKVVVQFNVLKKYAKQLNADAKAVSQRTFVIGEKVIALRPGTKEAGPIEAGSFLEGEEALEITDMLSGGRMSKYFETFELLMEQIKVLVGATGKEGNDLAGLYLQMHKTLKGVELLSKDVHIMRKDVFATDDTRLLLRNLAKSSADIQQVMADLKTTLPYIQQATGEFNGLAPGLSKALQESIITLQAMQKSFFLRGGVKEVLQENERSPASVD